MTRRAWRGLVVLALLVVTPALALAAPDCESAADGRVRACRRWDPDWPVSWQPAPHALSVRVAEGVTLTPPAGVWVPDETPDPGAPHVPGTPALPDPPGVPPALFGQHGERPVLLVLRVDAVWTWPPGSGDVTVHGALVVGRDFVPVFARVQWVDGNEDAIPDAVATQGPFALVTPVAL